VSEFNRIYSSLTWYEKEKFTTKVLKIERNNKIDNILKDD